MRKEHKVPKDVKLYHVSEDASIKLFKPRPAPGLLPPDDLAVWAISEDKIANYLFPRDCPGFASLRRQRKRLSCPSIR